MQDTGPMHNSLPTNMAWKDNGTRKLGKLSIWSQIYIICRLYFALVLVVHKIGFHLKDACWMVYSFCLGKNMTENASKKLITPHYFSFVSAFSVLEIVSCNSLRVSTNNQPILAHTNTWQPYIEQFDLCSQNTDNMQNVISFIHCACTLPNNILQTIRTHKQGKLTYM